MNLRIFLIVLDLRSSPGTMSCSSPEQDLVASPDCSIICDDQDFFKLVRWLIMMIKCCTFISNFHSPSHLQASGQMNPQKAIFTGKLKVRGNFLLLQKLQSIFWKWTLYNISESEIHHWKFIQFICSVQKYSENWCQYKKLSFVARTFKFPGNIC